MGRRPKGDGVQDPQYFGRLCSSLQASNAQSQRLLARPSPICGRNGWSCGESSPGHLPRGRRPELTCRLEPALPCLAAGGGAALGRTLSPAVSQTGAWRGADAARQSAVLTVATLPGGQR